jgi:hypothetical protein
MVAASVAPCDGLILEREPHNRYDSGAVKVLHHSTHIGYVQRDVAASLSRLMDNGVFYTATTVKNKGNFIIVNIYPIDPPKNEEVIKQQAPLEVVE